MADTIETELQRLEQAAVAIKEAIIAKGVYIPSGPRISDMPTFIAQIKPIVWLPEEDIAERGHIDIKLKSDFHKIFYGTASPTSSVGSDGDTYIKY